MSTAILQLSENGELQKLHDKWLNNYSECSNTSTDESNRLNLVSFWGLFLICGIACLIALMVFFGRLLCQYRRFSPEGEATQDDDIEPARPSRRTMHSTSFKSFREFVDRKEEEIKDILKKKSGDSKRHASHNSDVQSSSSPS